MIFGSTDINLYSCYIPSILVYHFSIAPSQHQLPYIPTSRLTFRLSGCLGRSVQEQIMTLHEWRQMLLLAVHFVAMKWMFVPAFLQKKKPLTPISNQFMRKIIACWECHQNHRTSFFENGEGCFNWCLEVWRSELGRFNLQARFPWDARSTESVCAVLKGPSNHCFA